MIDLLSSLPSFYDQVSITPCQWVVILCDMTQYLKRRTKRANLTPLYRNQAQDSKFEVPTSDEKRVVVTYVQARHQE